MPGLDTNVLVRWLVEDDDTQVARAKNLFETARSRRTTLFVPDTVMLELEWVLRSRYGFDKSTVLGAFSALLETQELEFQTESAIERALHLYRLGAAEFRDCLHAGICGAADRSPMLTFDERAARLPSVRSLAK
jgi:predicted nucleic-acid-binding protein